MAFVQSAMNTALAPTSIAFNNQRVMSLSAMTITQRRWRHYRQYDLF
jgi:hypothetical protein